MSDYDFSQLNDKEFEVFSTDLMSGLLGKRIERFKSGKDGGVDGRFYSMDNHEVILQYKHYVRTGFKGLVSKLLQKELPKVKKLHPDRYILVTSVPLSRPNKAEIKKLFSPFIATDNDIFGQEDLNDELAKWPDIEEKHYKLWITSTNVFNRILNNAIKGRSEYEIKRIKDNSFKYIETNNHNEAIKILRENHVVIITGEPGVGKTTLAENLCLYYTSKDYEFLDIEESISEAEDVCFPGKLQIFYFDDFLGSNYFEAIENKKDAHIVKFIDRIRNDKTKLFILTSRTNILNSGVLHSAYFLNHKIHKNEYLLTISKFTEIDKARILYNHIWFSNLPTSFIDEINQDKRYFDIIRHRNFNPRLVEFITDTDRIPIESDKYWSHIESTLNNPKDIWGDCFKNQNNAFVRNMVFLTVFNGGSISEDDLRDGYIRLCRLDGLTNTSHTEKDFDSMARIATKTFLDRNKNNDYISFDLFNPSIADFILNEYCKDVDRLINIFKSLRTVRSLERLIALENEGLISGLIISRIKEAIFNDSFVENKDDNYLIRISYLFKKDEEKRNQIGEFLKGIAKKPTPISEIYELFCLIPEYEKEMGIIDFDFIKTCIDNRTLNEYEIDSFAGLLEYFDISDSDLSDLLKENLMCFLSDEMNGQKDDIDLSNMVRSEEGFEGDVDIHCDTTKIERKLTEIANNLIDHLSPSLLREMAPSAKDLVSKINIDDMTDNYLSSLEPPDIGEYGHNSSGYGNDVEDLFERT
jgi:hypothetical protein